MKYLDSDENIVLKNIKSRPFFLSLITEFAIVVGCLVVVALFVYILIKLNNSNTLKNMESASPIFKYYNVFLYVVIAAISGFIIYQTVSAFVSDVIITNKAVIKKNVFGFEKIYFNEITNMQVEKMYSMLEHRSNRRTAYVLATLTGTNNQVVIYGTKKNIQIQDMTKRYANELIDDIKTQVYNTNQK